MKVPPARRARELSGWLEANAFGLDTDSALAAEVLPRLAADGELGVGGTVLRLAQFPNIVGLKDATGDIGRGISLMRSLPSRAGSSDRNKASARTPRINSALKTGAKK